MIISDPVTDILIVDDREDGLIALEAVLAQPGLNLVRASSGLEALSLLHKYDFAAVLLDVQMPGIDGFETAQRMKMDPRYRHIPVIFVTAINKDEAYVYKGYTFGAVDYVFKPFDAHVLRSKVAVFVDLFNKSQQLEKNAEAMRESERRERYLRLAELEVESLKRYRNLADAIPHLVWRAKADGTMDYFNRMWTTFTGLSDEQSHGMGWQTAFEPDDLKVFLKGWMKSMLSGEDFQAECRIQPVTGESRWHWIRAVPERRTNGDVLAWLGTCTDIHERKMAERHLIEARKEADAANQAKTNFLANMSHEIRTPLNSILGFTELMLQPQQSRVETMNSLYTIKRNGRQLLKIIDEILDISKVEADRMEIERIDVDLRSLLAEMQSLLEVQAQEKKLGFAIRCANKIPAKIKTDPTRLTQILTNIIGNAIKFTMSGNVSVVISWKAADKGSSGKLRFLVSDTGVGIASDQAARLFKPFTQADSSTSRKFGGTGLGLALSKRLAQALDGDLTLIESQTGSGSSFAIEITADIADQATFFEYSDHLPEYEVTPASKAALPMLKDVDVLVVDDASDNRTLISRFLTSAGAQVDCAANGFEGVEKALAKTYHVVLMDIQMPEMDGYAATTRLREKGYYHPIIALTAHALKEERERSLKVGCDDHLTKPIDRAELIGHVARLAGCQLQ